MAKLNFRFVVCLSLLSVSGLAGANEIKVKQAFKDADGNQLVVSDLNMMYWKKGGVFVHLGGYGRLPEETRFRDYRLESSFGKLVQDKTSLKLDCGGKKSELSAVGAAQMKSLEAELNNPAAKIDATPYENSNYIEYAFQLEGKNIFIVSTDKDIPNKKNGKFADTTGFHIGEPGAMKEGKIETIGRNSDGGTTVINTDLGKMYSPSALSPVIDAYGREAYEYDRGRYTPVAKPEDLKPSWFYKIDGALGQKRNMTKVPVSLPLLKKLGLEKVGLDVKESSTPCDYLFSAEEAGAGVVGGASRLEAPTH